MQNADEWSPWMTCHPGHALPFQAGDYIRIRTFINQEPYRSAEGFITAAVICEWVFCTMTTLRPGRDWIEVSVRRPRGMRILIDVLENLPVKVVHE